MEQRCRDDADDVDECEGEEQLVEHVPHLGTGEDEEAEDIADNPHSPNDGDEDVVEDQLEILVQHFCAGKVVPHYLFCQLYLRSSCATVTTNKLGLEKMSIKCIQTYLLTKTLPTFIIRQYNTFFMMFWIAPSSEIKSNALNVTNKLLKCPVD